MYKTLKVFDFAELDTNINRWCNRMDLAFREGLIFQLEIVFAAMTITKKQPGVNKLYQRRERRQRMLN